MAKFLPRTTQENSDLARRMLGQIGEQIRIACRNASPSESFLAGLISVENSKLDPRVTRFESGVFESLRNVRDGHRPNFGSIVQDDIDRCDDRALVNLSTSYGLTQIMGYHSIKTLRCSIADLREPDRHLAFAVRLLEIVAGAKHNPNYFEAGQREQVLRIWNTGSPTGKTFDPYYVRNAMGVFTAYAALEASPR